MNDELIAHAAIGEQVADFLETDIGKILVGIAKQEYQLAIEAIAETDPFDAKAIQKLQNQAQLYKHFREWLAELVDKGIAAREIFMQQERTE